MMTMSQIRTRITLIRPVSAAQLCCRRSFQLSALLQRHSKGQGALLKPGFRCVNAAAHVVQYHWCCSVNFEHRLGTLMNSSK
jgi:hypothetical protein